jgi:hypothetical protein
MSVMNSRRSFDHFVGAQQKRDPDRLGGFQIDDQLEFRRGGQFYGAKEHARDVAARPRKASDVTALNRIEIDSSYHDRNGATRADPCLQRDFGSQGNDQIGL